MFTEMYTQVFRLGIFGMNTVIVILLFTACGLLASELPVDSNEFQIPPDHLMALTAVYAEIGFNSAAGLRFPDY